MTISCAKQLIEDTIRRNASPVRFDEMAPPGAAGSCSSLASSASDEAMPKANRSSVHQSGSVSTAHAGAINNFAVPNQASSFVFAG